MFAFVHIAVLMLLASPNLSNRDVELLRAKDQALLDAIGSGDRKVWDNALAPDALVVDESGSIVNRSEFLEQLSPLPPNVSGSLQIVSYSAQISGDLATVIHTDDERENYHGQMLHSQYVTTETWHLDEGQWKLHLVHVYAILKDPPVISLPGSVLQQYAGRYKAAADLIYVIQWNGKQLLGGREGSPLKRLEVELRDVLFVPGQPRIRMIFQRDETGQVTAFLDRRESWDLVWRRDSAGAQ
ncbi:MAG: nuclear transport factor 2 family protein [Candidatus Acidiferrales bacterium]